VEGNQTRLGRPGCTRVLPRVLRPKFSPPLRALLQFPGVSPRLVVCTLTLATIGHHVRIQVSLPLVASHGGFATAATHQTK